MLYLDEIQKLEDRTIEVLENINHTLSELYVKKAQIDELRAIDNHVANKHEENFDLVPPEDEIERLNNERGEMRNVLSNIHQVKGKLEAVDEKFSRVGIDLSDHDLSGVEYGEIESFLNKIEKRIEMAELLSNHTATLEKSEVRISNPEGYSEERDLIKEMLMEAKAVELFDDERRQKQFLAANMDYPFGEFGALSWEYDDDPEEIEEIGSEQLDAHEELDSYSLDAIISNADNLFKSRSESASECLRRAESIKRLLVRINNDNSEVEFGELIEDLELLITRLEIKSNSETEMKDRQEITSEIEDIVFKIKDISYSELSN